MPKLTKEESDSRRNEVIDACEALYREESYHDITMSQIAEGVSFGRANIYNYFQCKDEVLLALLQREHELWAADLEGLAGRAGALGDTLLAEELAATVQAREQMLKLMAMNIYDMEQNSRLQSLVEFKRAYARAIAALRAVLAAAKPQWDDRRADRFIFGFMPCLHGVYPYAHHTEKQRAAMQKAGVPPSDLTVCELVQALASSLLAELD